MTPQQDQADLAEYVRAGSREALGRLARRHVDFVYGVARREVGGDAHLADDVTQAVFLVLARRAGHLRAATLTAWLFTTARYVAANARKVEARRRHHERLAAMARATEEATMKANDAANAEHLRHLHAALAAQREADRAVVLMRFVQGLDFAQIADAFGLSEAAARKRVERALDRLREFLVGRGITPESAALGAALGGVAQSAPSALTAAVSSLAPAAGAVGLAKMSAGACLWAQLKSAAAIALTIGVLAAVVSGMMLARHSALTPTTVGMTVSTMQSTPHYDAPPSGASSAPAATSGPADRIVYTGVVTDPSDKPVPNVRVSSELEPRDSAAARQTEAESVTDNAGRYALEPLPVLPESSPDSRWLRRRLLFDAPGFAMAWRDIDQRTWPWEDRVNPQPVQLQQAKSLQVLVMDEQGKPVAGARVRVELQCFSRWHAQTPGYGYLTLPRSGYGVQTDSAGTTVFERLPAEARAHVTVSHPELARFSSRDGYHGDDFPISVGTDTPYRVVLRPGGRIRAQLALGPRPVPEAVHVWAVPSEAGAGGAGAVSDRVPVSKDGRCELSGLSPGTYDVSVLVRQDDPSQRLIPLPVRRVSVTAGNRSDITVSFAPAQKVTGRIVDDQTKLPVGGQYVSGRSKPNNPNDRPIGFEVATTDPHGRFTIWALPGACNLETSSHPRNESVIVRKTVQVTADLPADAGDIDVVQWPLLRGRLVDADGQPVVGRVICEGDWVRTAGDGSFALGRRYVSARERPARLFAFSEDRSLGTAVLAEEKFDRRVATTAPAGLADLPTIPLHPVATVSGSVSDADGSALTDARIDLLIQETDGLFSSRARPLWGGFERDGASFTYHFLPTGVPMQITIERPGAQESVKLDDLRPGEWRDVGAVVLRPRADDGAPADRDFIGSINGVVRDEAGKPIAGVRIQAMATTASWHPRDYPVTDHEGRFALQNLPLRERMKLICTSADYQDHMEPVEIGAGVTDVTIHVQRVAAGVIGKAAPEIEATQWINGDPVRLSDLRGKVVLLQLVANVRGNYVEQSREVLDAHDKYSRKGLVVIAVHQPIDGTVRNRPTVEQVEQYVKDHNVPFAMAVDAPHVAADENELSGRGETEALYGMNRYMACVVIDKKGIVRCVPERGHLHEWIEKLLRE